VHCESTVPVAVVRGQFTNLEKGERPPLEAGTRGLVKGQQTGETQCVSREPQTDDCAHL
jgi:hypothetical protein